MAKLKDIIGKEAWEKLPKETQEKYSKADLEDVSEGKYIPKDRFEQVNEKAKEYKKQVGERDKQITDLKEEFKDAEGLKEKVETLETANKEQKEKFEAEIKKKDETYALEKSLSSLNFKSESTKKYFMSQIDMEKVKVIDGEVIGLKEQVEGLKKDNDFCFAEEQKKKGAPDFTLLGGEEGNEGGEEGNEGNKSYGARLADKRKKEEEATKSIDSFFGGGDN